MLGSFPPQQVCGSQDWKFQLLRPGLWTQGQTFSFLKGKVKPLVGHSPSSQVCFSLLQRKSSKAKEKKQKRLEERAAMDAVCAKVDAANRVTLSSFPVPSSRNCYLVFNFTSFGATLWQNCVTTYPRLMPPCLGKMSQNEPGSFQVGQQLAHRCREMWIQMEVAAPLCGSPYQ